MREEWEGDDYTHIFGCVCRWWTWDMHGFQDPGGGIYGLSDDGSPAWKAGSFVSFPS